MQATRGVGGSGIPFVFLNLGKLARLDPKLSRQEIVERSMNKLVSFSAGHEDPVEASRFHQYLTGVDSIEREEIELLSSLLLGAMLRDMCTFGDVRDPFEDLDPILAVQGSDGMAIESLLLVPSVAENVKSSLQQPSGAFGLDARPACLQDARQRQQQRM